MKFEYSTVGQASGTRLDELIVKMMADGWKLQGGGFVSKCGEFCQTMIRETEPKFQTLKDYARNARSMVQDTSRPKGEPVELVPPLPEIVEDMPLRQKYGFTFNGKLYWTYESVIWGRHLFQRFPVPNMHSIFIMKNGGSKWHLMKDRDKILLENCTDLQFQTVPQS